MVGSDAFNLITYVVSPTRMELAVYRVSIYIRGEFVRQTEPIKSVCHSDDPTVCATGVKRIL